MRNVRQFAVCKRTEDEEVSWKGLRIPDAMIRGEKGEEEPAAVN